MKGEEAATQDYPGQQEAREWAESVFAARAAERGLAVSKPSGDSESFDYVVGHPGKFVGVQVKCTIAKQPNEKGYICNLKSNNEKYRSGSFDFVAAYAILEDTWYIIPAPAIRGMSAICLCSTMPKYEKYREAWNLLREATSCEVVEESSDELEETRIGPGFARMQSAMKAFRRMMERGGR